MNILRLSADDVRSHLKKYETLTVPERFIIDKWLRENFESVCVALDKASGRADDLDNECGAYIHDIDDLKDTVTDLETQIKDKDSEIDRLTTDIANHELYIADLEDNIADLNTQLACKKP